MSTSPRDEALVAEQVADLLDGRVRARQHQVGRAKVVGRQLVAGRADAGQQRLQRGGEGLLRAAVGRLQQVLVQAVQLVEVGVGDVELPLADDAHDHRRSSSTAASSAGAAPPPPPLPSCLVVVPPSSPLMRASSASTAGSAALRSSSACSRSLEADTSSRAPEAISSSMAPARACIWATLSSARCMAMPTSPISSPIPEMASLTLVCASAAV